MVTLLQTNLNNFRKGMVTLTQVIEELDAGLVIVAKPVIFDGDPRWIYSGEKKPKVGIFWRKVSKIHAPMQMIKNGAGYVLVRWNRIYVMGCYFSPNRTVGEFSKYLTRISTVIRNLKNVPLIIAGDFNARHGNWDSGDTNHFGKKFFDWIVNESLVILNNKDETTCRRYQGELVIDIMLVNSLAKKMVTQWRIEEDRRILSDHCVISMKISARTARDIFMQSSEKFPKWNYKKINIDFLTGFAESRVWGMESLGEFSAGTLASWISDVGIL
jgi:hypothetical protein